VEVPVAVPDLAGDRANLSISDRLSVKLCDGHDATCGCAHQDLVGIIRHLDRDSLDANFDAVGTGNVDDAPAGDALEDAALRSEQLAVLDETNVEARALSQVRVAVSEERVSGTTVVGLEQTTGEIAPLVVLHGRVDGARRNSADCAGDDGSTTDFLDRRIHDPNVRLNKHVKVVHEWNVAVEATDTLEAAGDDDLDKGIADATLDDHIAKNLPYLISWDGEVQASLFASSLQTVEVIFETEEAAVPDGRNIVCEIAVHETLVHQWNSCLSQWHILALDPGDALGVLVIAGFQHSLPLAVLSEHLIHGCHFVGV